MAEERELYFGRICSLRGFHTEEDFATSFFLGHVVDDLRSDLNGKATIKLAGQNNWQLFDAHATLFADAQRLGWTTGVVGYHIVAMRLHMLTEHSTIVSGGRGTWFVERNCIRPDLAVPVIERRLAFAPCSEASSTARSRLAR